MIKQTDTPGILCGLRVIDLTSMLSGPYCTMMLADHGAEVIKIETATGDTSRSNGPFRSDDPEHKWGGYFVSLNRSKKSVVLDLKSGAGKQQFLKLARTAHIVVENFRPGVMERLGLSYETLAEQNPALVYAAVRGFGDNRTGESPYSGWPSYDVVAQAMGGLIAITGPDAATPMKVGPGVGDIFTGLHLAFGILAAVRHAERTGEGQYLDVAMYDAVLSLCERTVYQHSFEGTIPGPEGNAHPLLAPFGVFEARDGHVTIGCVEDAFWKTFAEIIGPEGFEGDERFTTKAARRTNRDELNALVNAWTRRRTKAELQSMLGGKIPFGPVNNIEDIRNDPHTTARGMILDVPNPQGDPWQVAATPIKFTKTPAPPAKAPPALDAHAASLLSEDDQT
jgi:crotonobetainyl-CoA:carnitine CoA-transferase CaiB-like acyl-CoA transferase